jgi:hypothetical protein
MGARAIFAARVSPFVEGQDDEHPSVVGLLNAIHGAYVDMIQSRSGLGFRLESALQMLDVTYFGGKELQCHRSPEPDVDGLVDHPHASGTQFPLNLVMQELSANRYVSHAFRLSLPMGMVKQV